MYNRLPGELKYQHSRSPYFWLPYYIRSSRICIQTICAIWGGNEMLHANVCIVGDIYIIYVLLY